MSKPAGVNAEGAGNTLDSYEKPNDDTLNKVTDEMNAQITKYVASVGSEKKFKFALDGLDNLKNMGLFDAANFTDFMDKLGGIVGDKLSAMASNQLNRLKKMAEETGKELMYIAKDFVVGLAEQLIDFVASRIYMCDDVILLQLKAVHAIGSNIRYNSDWIRTYMISIDYVKTVKWIDSEYGFRYNWEEDRGRICRDLNNAAKNSCIEVVTYMMDYVYVQSRDLNNKVINTDKWIEDNDIKDLEATRDELIAELAQLPEEAEDSRLTLEADLNKLLAKIDRAEKRYAAEPNLVRDNNKDRNTVKAMQKQMYKTVKNLIVNSYGNVTVEKLKKLMERCNIQPAVFGYTDELFNGEFYFSTNDINRMAPFFESHDQIDSTNYTKDSVKERYGDSMFADRIDTSKNSQGGMKNLQDDLGDTRLVKTSNLPKYIILRNIHMKHIYVYLASAGIWGPNRLYHDPLYERLCHPVMDMMKGLLDDAAKNLMRTGLGAGIVDALLFIERLAYKLVNDQKELFTSPAKMKYLQYYTDSVTLPVPSIDVDDTSKKVSETTENPLTTKENKDKKQEATDLFYYYFENIRPTEYLALFDTIFRELYRYYEIEDNPSQKIVLKDIIAHYFTADIKRTDKTFDIEYFLKFYPPEQIPNKTITFVSETYVKTYESWYDEPRDNENTFIPLWNDSIQPLLKFIDKTMQEKFFSEFINHAMTPTDVYEKLRYIYNFCGKNSIYITNYEAKQQFVAFLREYYSENAYTVGYNVQEYLKTLNDEQRRKALYDMMKKIFQKSRDKSENEIIREKIWIPIVDNVLPVFQVSVTLKPGTDFDITNEEEVKKYLNSITNSMNHTIYVRDFDNKVVDVTYQSPLELDKPYDESQYPRRA